MVVSDSKAIITVDLEISRGNPVDSVILHNRQDRIIIIITNSNNSLDTEMMEEDSDPTITADSDLVEDSIQAVASEAVVLQAVAV